MKKRTISITAASLMAIAAILTFTIVIKGHHGAEMFRHSDDECQYEYCPRHGRLLTWMNHREAWTIEGEQTR